MYKLTKFCNTYFKTIISTDKTQKLENNCQPLISPKTKKFPQFLKIKPLKKLLKTNSLLK